MASWPQVALGDVAELRAGTGFPLEFQGRSDEAYPFAKVSDISAVARFGAIDISEAAHSVSEKDLQALRVMPFPPGTVAFAKIGEAIRQNYRVVTTRPMLFDNNVMGLIPDANQIDGRFLLRFLQTQDFYARTGRTAVPAIRSGILRAVRVPLPPLPEQRRIAAILDKVDAVRRKRQQTLDLADQFLRSAFLDMFGDPVTNPKGWDIVSLLEVSTRVTDGTHQPPAWAESGIPFLFVSNIRGGTISFDTQKFISQDTWEQLTRRCPIEPNDILYTTVGSYGNAAIVATSRQFAFQRHIAHIKPDTREIHPEYLVGSLQSPAIRRQADESVRGIAQKTLNLEDLKRFRIFLPPMPAQERYVRLRRQSLAHGAAIEAAVASEGMLLSTLIQRAFRGEL
jgi:type I restriction enzyme S subunit